MLILGIIGLTSCCIGIGFSVGSLRQRLSFLMGVSLLLLYALSERSHYYVALQIVALTGTTLAFTRWELTTRAHILTAVTITALIWLWCFTQLGTVGGRYGVAGLIALAFGYATSLPMLFVVGGIFVALHSGLAYLETRSSIACLYLILNVIFSITAAFQTFRAWKNEEKDRHGIDGQDICYKN